MGILANTKEFLARKTAEVAKRAADGIASTSALSPKQMELVAKKREEYLSQKPDMSGEDVQKVIRDNLGAVGIEVYQAYLEQLKSLYSPIDTAIENFDELNRIRFFDVTKWVIDSEEQNLDKLVNVYQVLSEEDCNIALIYHRTKEKCEVTIGVVNTDMGQADPSKVITFDSRLQSAISGNFPGVEIRCNVGKKDTFGLGIPQNLQQIIKGDAQQAEVQSVAIVSNLASEKSEDFISQSMEKLLDGIIPQNENEEYTIVLLAKPINNQLERKNRLFELYSALAPYASWQTNYTYTQSDAINSSANFGVNLGMSAGTQLSVAKATGTNTPRINEEAKDESGKNKTGFWKGVKNTAKQVAGMYAPIQDTNTTTNTVGYQASANFGVSFARSSSVTAQIGINEGLTQTYANYGVQHTLEIIENQLKRLEESSALGMWEFAGYITSKSPVIANNVAHMYLALTQGDESYITRAAVNLWDGEENKEDAQTILKNIQKLQHPVFGLKVTKDDEWLLYPTLVTPSAALSGKELAKSLNFPRKSISGLPVIQSTAFGREVQKFVDIKMDESAKREIIVGQIYHMRHTESCSVNLNVESLASHTFITGSTGTGKSNVIYQLLSKLKDNSVKFLVVEPAKGDYKRIFGGICNVYGTNYSKSELLHINPFSFPKGIHVLEHIDRLVEIFNACWPMYAAMPAVLKDAVEKSYEKVGWNLRNSKCEPLVFPTFADLMETLPDVMNSSLYSADTKSDYSGALITRVQSLTNGINGQIFCSNKELTAEELFEQNVIVDLSRVGSTETKSLLMGIVVMKLQEYRLHQDIMNSELIHVTILEEAHNLLRKTATGQSQEGANLQGKSVEMLTNSIAEMRTYGEGFIIADQSPALLDEAVIRNTNTKIVLRLPDDTDRKLVGTSMALNDNQIIELAKLPKGVAAVYQNDWVEAVLCHFEKYERMQPLQYTYTDSSPVMEHYFKKLFGIKDSYEISDEDADLIKEWIHNLRNSERTKILLSAVLKGEILTTSEREIVAYNVFEGKKLAGVLAGEMNAENGITKANNRIKAYMGLEDNVLIENIRSLIMGVIFRTKSDGELSQRYLSVEETRRPTT
jgi:ATP-binding protein